VLLPQLAGSGSDPANRKALAGLLCSRLVAAIIREEFEAERSKRLKSTPQ
jgi:hypothetical protein